MGGAENEPLFGAASVWEIAIKHGLGREDFQVDVRLLRRGLLDNGYGELPVGSEPAVALDGLPPLHKDPFDRLLLAQALVEGVTLLTSDAVAAQYPGPVRKVSETPNARPGPDGFAENCHAKATNPVRVPVRK